MFFKQAQRLASIWNYFTVVRVVPRQPPPSGLTPHHQLPKMVLAGWQIVVVWAIVGALTAKPPLR